MPQKFKHKDVWTKLVIFYLWSSPFFGKASAFVGMAVGLALLLDNRIVFNRWYGALTRPDTLSGFSWTILVSVLFGVAEVVYGLSAGNSLTPALQVFLYNFYPLYIFLGIWVGSRDPEIMRRYVRYGAWFMVAYTPLYFLFFSHMKLTLSGILPGSDLDLFGRPGTGSETLLGLFAYEPKLAGFWLPIILASFLTIANQIRADWLGFGLALMIWGAATKKLGRVFGMAGAIVLLLLIGFLADVKLPPLPGRSGELSARDTVARALAAASPEAAEGLTSTSNSRFYYGTVYWRQIWWAGIREAVFQTPGTTIFGLGYGYPIKNLGATDLKKSDVRSPHNIFYFVLAYSGFVGVAIFYTLQFWIMLLLWKTFKATGQIYGFASYAAMLLGAHFGNFLETPQAGIPTYLVAGLCIGPLFRKLRRVEASPRRVVLPQLMRPVVPAPAPRSAAVLQMDAYASEKK